MSTSSAVIALAGAVIGALITGASSWAVARRARKEAEDSRRREAYAGFIIAVDELERLWNAPATLSGMASAQAMGPLTARAVAAVQRCYVAVLLTGSARAQNAASSVRNSAWALHDYLYPSGGQGTAGGSLQSLIGRITTDGRSFVQIAQGELGQRRRQGWRRPKVEVSVVAMRHTIARRLRHPFRG